MQPVKKIFFLLISSVLIVSCKNSNQNTNNIIDGRNTKELIVDQSIQICEDEDYFKECVPVFLETNSNSLIKKIDKIMLDDDFLFVFDRSMNNVVIFNKNGDYISRISSVGIGQGEYKQLTDVCIDPVKKQIVLCPDYPNKLMFFDYSGNFLHEKSIKELYREIVMIDEHFYLLRSMPHKDKENPCFLSRIDNDTFGEDCFFTPPTISDSPFFDFGHLLTRGKSDVFFTTRYNNSIYKITPEKIEKAYNIDFKSENLPDKYNTKDIAAEDLKEISSPGSPYVYSISEVNDNSGYLSFKTNKPGFYIYKKSDERLTFFNSLHISQYEIYSGRMQHIENAENIIAFLIDPGFLMQFKKVAEEKNISISQQTLEFINKVKSDDNPIVFLCEFKNQQEH
ncbi:MAG: 6-bladed beta-propeller [Dysgonamonadaceae bacterium]|jgi:hypothetical protein|nr:6-bladed beta-propeller [Dysgonamonadaceae bacterium]